MKFSQITKSEYNNFQKQHPYRDFMNSVHAMDLKVMNHWDVEYVGVKEDNKLICATALTSIPVMKIFRFYYAQRGFLIDYNNKDLLNFFVSQLKSYLKAKKALYLLIDPNVLYKERDIDANLVEGGFDNSHVIKNLESCAFEHQGFTKNFQVLSEVRWMFSLYLKDKDEDTVLKEMHQQTRWSINKTLKQGIQVRELSIDELDIFIKMMNHTSKRRNFEQRDAQFYKNQMIAFKEDAKLLMAYLDIDNFRNQLDTEKATLNEEYKSILEKLEEMPNSKKFIKKKKVCLEALDLNSKKYKEADKLEKAHGTIIPMATSFFITQQDECVYLYSASYDEFKKYNAPYAIQWHMIQECIKNHISRYNFYGLSGDFDKDSVDYGVYEFKKGFGGVVEELVGDFILPIRPLQYRLYKKLKHL